MKSRFFLVCLIWIVVAVNAFGENMIGKTEVDVNKDNVVNVADIVTICDIMNPVFVIDF